jgi:hypothetical protein
MRIELEVSGHRYGRSEASPRLDTALVEAAKEDLSGAGSKSLTRELRLGLQIKCASACELYRELIIRLAKWSSLWMNQASIACPSR